MIEMTPSGTPAPTPIATSWEESAAGVVGYLVTGLAESDGVGFEVADVVVPEMLVELVISEIIVFGFTSMKFDNAPFPGMTSASGIRNGLPR